MTNIFWTAILILATSSAQANKIKENDSFPAFKLSGVKEKKSQDLGALTKKNKVVIIDFWASWCGPCKEAMPVLDKVAEKYKGKGVSVIGINVDQDKEAAKKFMDEVKVRFPLIYDENQKISGKVGVPAMPSSYILDNKGKVKFIHKGFYPGDDKKYETEIDSLLKGKAEGKQAAKK
jgi:thiol-disulfide isomerase/thioredoxin